MGKPKILCVVGTRPEGIKMAPLVQALRGDSRFQTVLASTGQHREMLAQALGAFGLAPDCDLDIMVHGQTLAEVTARSLNGLSQVVKDDRPEVILAQGDTTATFCASLIAFYERIPFGHVEAGLRTESVDLPFPEEFNRRAAGLVANWHFAPTQWAAENLLKEGKAPETVFVTGNTGVDAVLRIAQQDQTKWYPQHSGRLVLLTTHRRENWGEPMLQIARAARTLVERFEDVLLVVAMHRNPIVREALTLELGGHGRIELIEPPDYAPFVKLIQRSTLILTDSGGIQEEAPAFGKPVLVLRTTTERPEGVSAGTARLVGTDYETIVSEAGSLLEDVSLYAAMSKAVSPYGDGKASERIVGLLAERVGKSH